MGLFSKSFEFETTRSIEECERRLLAAETPPSGEYLAKRTAVSFSRISNGAEFEVRIKLRTRTGTSYFDWVVCRGRLAAKQGQAALTVQGTTLPSKWMYLSYLVVAPVIIFLPFSDKLGEQQCIWPVLALAAVSVLLVYTIGEFSAATKTVYNAFQ